MKDTKHFIAVAVLIAVSTFVMKTVILKAIFVLPLAASSQAAIIDGLFDLHFWLIAFLFSLIMVFMLYSVVVFRRQPGDESDGAHIHGNTTLEIVWTVLPLIIVFTFAYLGTTTLRDVTKVEANEIRIEATGSQWNWAFAYPEHDGLESTVLALQVGQPVVMEMNSIDVLHSFWVPEFRVKQDLVPGQVTELRFTPTVEGDFKVRCAEMCGLSHAYMLGDVKVLSPANYDAWVNDQQSGANTPEGRGQKLSEVKGCLGCHTVDGAASVGPSWYGLYNREETLDNGYTAVADDAYLVESIVCPSCTVVSGFADGIMPQNFGEVLSEAEIQDLVAFIKSLNATDGE